MGRRKLVAAAAAALSLGFAGIGLPANVVRADVISQWTFNSTPVDNDPTTGTLSPETGAGTLAPVGGVGNSGFAQGSSNDASPTATGNNNSSFETQGYPRFDEGNKTAGIEIAVSTVGYQDITLSFEHNQFTGASASFRIQYSTNGTTFTDAAGYTGSTPNVFVLRGDDFSAISSLDNNASAKFRIVAEFQGQMYSGLSGDYFANARNRFDLVTVSGTPVPEPGAVAVVSTALLGLALRRRQR